MRTDRRKEFTVAWLDNIEPARNVWWDVHAPGLGVRVTDTGKVSFFVLKRIAGSKTPQRITLGRYPTIGLAKARKLAAGKLEVIETPRRGAPARRRTSPQGVDVRGVGASLQGRAPRGS